jgi:peptide/nickel transport system permease protein
MHETPSHPLLRGAGWRGLTIVAVVLVSGLLCATLVRFAPGFGVDERELDSRLNNDSVHALRTQHAEEENIVLFYTHYLGGMLRGDLGESHLFSQPVSQLVRERAPLTARNIGYGLLLAWCLALSLTLAAAFWQNIAADGALTAVTGVLLSLPAAVVGLLIAILRRPVALGIALALLPVLYRYARDIVQRCCARSWIVAARAQGIGKMGVLFRHVLPVAAPQLIALAGVSVNMGFGAALPIEVVADSPGIGQLAWQAALGRDLPLLVALTGIVTTITLVANASASLCSQALQTERS